MSMIQIQKLLSKLPEITGWIDTTLATHADQSRPVISFGFKRLPQYYSPQFLALAKVVVVESVPVPPLAALGLPELAAFEQGDYAGITFKDTYFVKAAESSRESLHFHELVHVVQWAHLGVEKFLTAYAAGLAMQGYRNSPLEVMAYDLQDHFDRNGHPGDLVAAVRNKLNELYP
ncbi:MAG TPA: hypothetical protein VNX46_01335 [Candidatus Acidoferrum sp.]|jgi:hypothetical protein|nr:hypothetical protein [Candidatus Acidoferrum sp.]